MKKMLALCLGIVFLTPSDAFASLEEAVAAIKEKDYNFATLELNRLITEENNADAMYQLSLLYEKGQGVQKNPAEAMRLLKQATESGSDKAAVKLGSLYYSGNDTLEKNYSEAFKLFKSAADKGNFTAQYNVGLMLEQGLGDENAKPDPVKAFQYYLKAGNQGYYLAQNALGRMYVEGVGTTQSYTFGMGWYRLAADQGHVDSQMKLAGLFSNLNVKGLPFNLASAHVYYNIVAAYAGSPYREQAIEARNKLIKKMQVKDIQAAQQYAQNWKKKSRLESYPPESFEGMVSLDEDFSRVGEEKAKKEEKKPITVLTELEDILIETGVSRRTLYNAIQSNDFSKIVSSLKAQADKGDQLSMVALGDLYLLGQGMEPDVAQAIQLYKNAADQGNAIAAFRLAPLYCQGNGVEKDMNECYKWFVLSEKYADEHSRKVVSETVKMLEQNLPAEQVAQMKKQMETYKTVSPESASVISMFKSTFFGSSDGSEKEKKQDASAKKIEPKKLSAPQEIKASEEKGKGEAKEEVDDIMAFPDL